MYVAESIASSGDSYLTLANISCDFKLSVWSRLKLTFASFDGQKRRLNG